MVRPIIGRTGEIYNGIEFLKVTNERNPGKQFLWELRCHCGENFKSSAGNVISGNTKSCGCSRGLKNLVDRTGEVYNGNEFLRRIERSENFKPTHMKWIVLCHCGEEYESVAYSITSGKTRSCGCLRKKMMTTHGVADTRLYKIFSGMKQRCNNPRNTNYKNYGGRGIKVCEEWMNGGFQEFQKWALSSGYSEKLTIDRIDVDRDYEPSNCQWTTMNEQTRNKRVKTSSVSGCTGVNPTEIPGKWRARIRVDTKEIPLGRFFDIREAVKARKEAEIKYWGKTYQDFDKILSNLELEERGETNKS